MSEPGPLTTAQKTFVGQQSPNLKKKKTEWKEVILESLVLNIKLVVFFFFFTLCQSSEYLQDALLTKLLGQFIKLDNTQILKD